MLMACSHLVIASQNVPQMVRFFRECFEVAPYFENKDFAEFVLKSKFRVAFFTVTGAASKHFSAEGSRGAVAVGVTVDNVDAFYKRIEPKLTNWSASVSGPPKDHPWGEKSFLLTDPEKNRWEIVQTPSADGMLTNRT